MNANYAVGGGLQPATIAVDAIPDPSHNTCLVGQIPPEVAIQSIRK